MKYLAIALPIILTACGGGSSDTTTLLQSDPPQLSGRCSNDYYAELRGVYDGEVTYTSPDLSCRWDLDFEVTTPSNAGLYCVSAANITSDLLAGDSACADIAQAGTFTEPNQASFAINPDLVVTWPVEATMTLNAAVDDSRVFPIGDTGATSLVKLRFDGRGNMTFQDTVYLDEGETFDGVLVKQ